MLLEFFVLIVVLLLLIYRWSMKDADFFEKKGIPYAKTYPFVGNFKDVILRKKSMFDVVKELYFAHDGRIYGVFDQQSPLLLIREPEMIKSITIKDFDHFINHRSIFGDDHENLFGSSLFLMVDNRWKDMRSTLSPAFTGSKMRLMFDLINQVSQDTVMYLKREKDIHTEKGLELNVKDYSTRFTNDIIASAAFGIQVNSFENKENEFFKMGKSVTNFTKWQNLKFFLYGRFKKIMKLLKIELFDRKYTEYFMRLVLDAMKYRKEHNIFRPDLINLLMEARGMIKSDNPKSHNREWSDTEIVGQCFLFFFAGFDTASVLMCMAAHELMENPDCQNKLREEVEEVTAQLDGKPLTYEALQGMKYMDMVVQEALRKWPGAIAIDRICTKDYEYTFDDGEKVEVKKGESVWIPVVGLHHDPKYWSNPEKFDPERFSDENKDNIVPFTFMPFGMGPRNCIGSRFALLEAKALLFYMIREYNIVPSKKSCIPLELSAENFQLQPKGGFWLKLKARVPQKV